MARLARILIYPIKSLDPISCEQSRVLPAGALEHDRRFAIVDAQGTWVNAKRTARIQTIRASYELAAGTVAFRDESDARGEVFPLAAGNRAIEAWLSDRLGQAVTLVENPDAGFPDDTDAPGPTLLSTATLQTVAGWFPGVTLDECRHRFRANLEVEDVPPFWEDQLYGESGERVAFRVGAVVFEGTNPCQRCVVPSRSPSSGVVTADFTRRFRQSREATLPPWAARSRFNHFYRLSVNTRLVTLGDGVLRVGDPVERL